MRRAPALPLAALAALLLGAGPARAAAQAAAATITETTFELPDGGVVRYGIALPPEGGPADGARPLVVALHPGGRAPYYGSSFMQDIVEPALRAWGAVIVAPDVPDRSWSTARAEEVVLALIEHVAALHSIDRRRVLVTGFSMGGRGAWHMAARHPQVFSGAIVMAGAPSASDVATIAVPIHLIHSPSDEVVDFGPVEDAYLTLTARGHPTELTVLPGAGHYAMGAYVAPLRAAGRWMIERWPGR